MGLLDKIKSLFNRNKPKQLGPGQENANNGRYMNFPQSFATSPNGDYTRVLSVEYKTQVTHRDGRVANIMVAQIANGKEDQVIVIGNEEYVAFEMPVGIPIDDNVLMGKLVGRYLYERNTMKNGKECVYIGEIDNDPNNNFINKNEKVEKYVDTKIAQQIREEKAREQAQIQHEREVANESEALGRAEFDKRIAFNIAEGKRKDAIEREQRMQNAYLRPQGNSYRANDGKIYSDYDGININTGDILLLKKVNKVGKDSNATQAKYLYTGYIGMSQDVDDVELLNKDGAPLGRIPVCFTLFDSLENILKQNDPNQIKNVLGLFSQENIIPNNNGYMNYIGSLDKYGNINQYVETRVMYNSIGNLQNEAREKKIRQQEQDGQDRTQ